MKFLIACEESGVVRDAFAKRGHNTWSCDLKPCRTGGKHLQCDVLQILNNGWDLMIAHPPCTYLTTAGNTWFREGVKAKKGTLTGKARYAGQQDGLKFVLQCWNAPIKKICLENPKGMLSTLWKKPDQVVDPFDFGHGHTKATHLWLKGLPLLTIPRFTDLPLLERVNWDVLSYAQDAVRDPAERSKTFSNIAFAMATQWG